MIVGLVRIIAVIALLGGAAALATPKGRLPLAFRGLLAIARKDRGLKPVAAPAAVPRWRRILALLLVLLAALMALF